MTGDGIPKRTEVAIIGAGIGGLIAAAKILECGIDSVVIFERRSDVGGVWHANKYPNIACDTAIELYGISFFPGDSWSRNFAPGNEIQSYIREFARFSGAADLVHFGTNIVDATWDETAAEWNLRSADRENWICRYLVWAGGALSQPLIPKCDGLSRFQGRSFHTVNWPDECDLRGKSVAVVGAGATAIQVVPHVVKEAKEAYIFVRTPSYVMPRPDIVFSAVDHASTTFRSELKERRDAWSRQFDRIAEARFPMVDAVVAEQEANWRLFFEEQVRDVGLRKIMTPNYRFGCKRPLFSNEYYQSLSQSNVEVVGKGISGADERGLIDAGGKHYDVDVIVWATGFDAAHMLGDLSVVGAGGQSLNSYWDDLPQAYFGVMVKGFPNLFLINGPNAGGPSATEFSEGQSDLIVHAIEKARLQGAEIIAVREEVHDAFNADLQRRFDGSVLIRGNCSSWYRVGGEGAVFSHWPGTTASFRERILTEAPSNLVYAKRC